MRGWRSIGAIAAVLCAAGVACSGGGGGGHDGGATISGLSLDAAFGRAFASPVKLVQHPAFDHRWYVVEQGGLVKTFLDSDTLAATTAANVPSQAGVAIGVSLGCTSSTCNSEQGLLGLAFDPDFATSRELYLAYTDAGNGNLVLARWVSSVDGLTFIPDAIILTIPHPNTNHNGSDIAFGSDGFLYYSTGDGGGSGDNAQNRNVLLGKILRINVNGAAPYAIPGTNPFAGNALCNTGPGIAPCPEIYAFGFRNPWRMNFDPDTGKLYVGDVGQGAREEIDIVKNGGNFGWNCFEGELPYNNVPPCNTETFVAPEVVYNDDPSGPNAVTGGAVYRGTKIPGLVGFYFYTDFYHGPFFAFDADSSNAPAEATSVSETHISAFGQGRDGEIYAVDLDGTIWKIVLSSG